MHTTKQKRRPFSRFYFLVSMRGQSTLEILIALAILVTAIVSAAAVIFGGQSASVDSQESNEALRLAQRNLEIAQASATISFATLAPSSFKQNEFTEDVIVQDAGASTKKIISQVSWKTDPQRTQKVELVTLVTDWYSFQASGGDTGGGGTTGNWTNPQTLGSIDLGPGESATGIDVKNKIIYLTATASDHKKPDFFIVDATDGQNPVVSTSLDTGSGLNAVDAAGNYAYVANDETSSQLQIIDISQNTTSSVVSTVTLAGVSGPGAVGNAVFYYNSKVYIGTQKASGPEFHVIDVSNPQSPSELGSLEVGADVNGISIKNNTAYLATSDNAAELKILDVTNPSAITQIGTYDAAGTYDGRSLYIVGTKLYLGRAGGSGDELRVLDVSNASSVVSLGSKDIGADVNGIAVRDNLAFLATSDSNKEFQVYDISNPASITSVSTFNFPQVASGVDFENNLVYVSVRSNDAVRIITSQ